MYNLNHLLVCGLVAALAPTAHSHTYHWGRECPSIEAFPNLDNTKITGQWYVLYKFDTSNSCLTWNITKQADATFSLTENRQFYILDAVNLDHSHALTAQLDTPNPEVPSRMRVRWPTSLTGKADFVVIDTDYDNYMAVFECDRAGFFHRRSVAVLSRVNVMDQAILTKVKETLDDSGIAHDQLHRVDQSSCRDQGRFHWHTNGELFGLLRSPPAEKMLGEGFDDYDLEDVEILGTSVDGFSGSHRQPKRRNVE